MLKRLLAAAVAALTGAVRRTRERGSFARERSKATLAARGLLAVASVAAVVQLLIAFFKRATYPYELEWMEGGVLDHVRLVLAGKPLYRAPSLEFTPFIYTPLYYHASAWASRVVGVGFLAPRLVSSSAALASMVLLARCVHREGAGRLAALTAAGLFAISFGATGLWMDIARVDSLALLFVIVAAFVARHRDSHASAVAVAAALCCAFFTKQTALVFAAPVLLSMCVTSFRRGLVAVVAFVLLTGALCLWMDRSTGGWFTYYVFEVPRHHGLRTSAWRQILVDSFGKPQLVPLLLTGSILSEARALRAPLSAVLLYGGLVFAGFVGSYSSLLHDDGFANVLLPYYAFVALGAALGLGQAIRLVDEGVSRSPVRERLGVLTIVAVLLHLGVSTYSSRNAIPRGRDVVAGDRMRETLRALPGPVLLLGSGFYGAMAGHPDIHAHTMALVDVLKTGDPARQASLTKDVVDGIRNRSFGAIIRDDSYAMLPAEVSAALASSYRLQGPVFTEAEADAMWPKTGYHSRPGEIWLR